MIVVSVEKFLRISISCDYIVIISFETCAFSIHLSLSCCFHLLHLKKIGKFSHIEWYGNEIHGRALFFTSFVNQITDCTDIFYLNNKNSRFIRIITVTRHSNYLILNWCSNAFASNSGHYVNRANRESNTEKGSLFVPDIGCLARLRIPCVKRFGAIALHTFHHNKSVQSILIVHSVIFQAAFRVAVLKRTNANASRAVETIEDWIRKWFTCGNS